MNKITASIIVSLSITSTSLHASDIKLAGTIQHSLRQPQSQSQSQSQSKSMHAPAPAPASIALLRFDLSPHARQLLYKNITETQSSLAAPISLSQSPEQVQLGMNNVPVLNQGIHGTCVVFAVTAAIDAVLNKGDYVSQLCELQLGQYLEKNAYQASGWNGSWGRNVLWQMSVFGLVNKTQQRSGACGTLTDYPFMTNAPDQDLAPETFHSLSESLGKNLVAWSSILDDYQISFDNVNPNTTLTYLKKTLAAGDRITIGVLLLDIDKGIVGAVGTHNAVNDTWVITPGMVDEINDQTELAGHALVITGYDDHAIAKDKNGNIYRGLFTLRNSWGPQIGDHGDFYMSYDYMKNLIIEAQRIRSLRQDD